MAGTQGVFPAVMKNGTLYYRTSITFKSKHISLGSFKSEESAGRAYLDARMILTEAAGGNLEVDHYEELGTELSFEKYVMLLNLRHTGMYCRNAIYLQNRYFVYYVDRHTPLKFDADDLFYYMNHKIMKRGGHLFISDYGMQVSILSRYGIKSFAVCGRDYRFRNGDPTDFRYSNLEILSRYHGVYIEEMRGRKYYVAKIHIRGDYIIGRYDNENEAAAAYNKAADILNERGLRKNFIRNYLEDLNSEQYKNIYQGVKISKKIREWK